MQDSCIQPEAQTVFQLLSHLEKLAPVSGDMPVRMRATELCEQALCHGSSPQSDFNERFQLQSTF